jgi:glycosyltransferase involved in cell wall biosynthesis
VTVLPERADLRILLVINGLDFGGTESAVEQLALHLARRGHEVRVLGMKPPGRTAHRLAERGIAVATLGMGDVVSARDMVLAAWRMRRLFDDAPVDVVQSFLPRANIVSRMANRLARSRAVHVSSERSTDFRRSRAVRTLNRLTARWSDLVLAVSPTVRDVLVARDRIPPGKIAVLENGIDLAAVDAVRPRDLCRDVPGVVAGRRLFGSIGRFVPEKGFVHLVRAVARMRRREDVQLLLVGEGPEEPAVREEVRRLGLERVVVFGGYHADALGILKGLDAYVLSSVEEGSPMVMLEAMACGLPVVATDVSGVAALAGPPGAGRAAIVVPPAADWGAWLRARGPGASQGVPDGDPVGRMAEEMDRLAADAGLRRTLAAAGRRRVEEAFTLERIVERLERHWASLPRGGAISRSAGPAACPT